MTKKQLRLRYWLWVAGWSVLIFSTLGIVRPICEFLKARIPFNAVITGLLGLTLAVIVLKGFSKNLRRKKSTYLFLAVILGVYVGLLNYLSIPEERIHLLQYGVLAFLIYRAGAVDFSRPWAYTLSFLLTSLIGWADESVQHLLPERYFQWHDVWLNSISALLALTFTYLIYRGDGRD